MKATQLLIIVITAILGMLSSCVSAQEQSKNSNRDYEIFFRAMSVISTGPDYVLIAVIDGRSGVERQIATSSNTLRSALRREYGLGYEDEDENKIYQIALSSLDRRFIFYKDSALARLKPTYTPEILAKVRNRLSSLTNEQIIAGLEPPAFDTTSLHIIYTNEQEEGYKDALAHVLLERSIACSVGDLVSQLLVHRVRTDWPACNDLAISISPMPAEYERSGSVTIVIRNVTADSVSVSITLERYKNRLWDRFGTDAWASVKGMSLFPDGSIMTPAIAPADSLRILFPMALLGADIKKYTRWRFVVKQYKRDKYSNQKCYWESEEFRVK